MFHSFNLASKVEKTKDHLSLNRRKKQFVPQLVGCFMTGVLFPHSRRYQPINPRRLSRLKEVTASSKFKKPMVGLPVVNPCISVIVTCYPPST
jgi:hypothetical protein